MSTTTVEDVDVVEIDFRDDLDLEFPAIKDFMASDLSGSDGSGTPHPGQDSTEERRKESSSNNDSKVDDELAQNLEPIVLSTSITTQYVKDLHETLQSPQYNAYRLEATFDIQSARTENGVPAFSVVVALKSKVTGDVVKELSPDDNCFPSKKRAKETGAGRMIEYLKDGLPAEIASLPTTASETGSARSDDPEETVNWIGKLHDFCQPLQSMPKYTFYQASPMHAEFSCDVTDIPTFGDQVFGDKTKFYRRKQIAKVQAAKAAVLHVEANPPSQELLTQPKKKNEAQKPGVFVGKVKVATPGSVITVPVDAGPVERVTLICPQLGLSLPEYRFERDENGSSLVDVTAYVRRGQGQKDVKIGPLNGIHGKTKAKTSMATSILRWLDREAQRLEVSIQTEGS